MNISFGDVCYYGRFSANPILNQVDNTILATEILEKIREIPLHPLCSLWLKKKNFQGAKDGFWRTTRSP